VPLVFPLIGDLVFSNTRSVYMKELYSLLRLG
jgi:hypothetical protein